MPFPPTSTASSSALSAALYHDPAPVGGVAVALLAGTCALFGVPVDLPLLVAGFCGVTVVYAVDRGWTRGGEDRTNHPSRVAWVQAHRGWLAAETAVLVALGGAMVPFLAGTTLAWTAALGLVAAAHVWPRGAKGALLRGAAKPVAIAGAWAVGGTVLPLVEAGHPVGGAVLVFSGYRMLFIVPNLLLADWADRVGDAAAGLAPWAAGWSGQQVRSGATALLVVAAAGVVAVMLGGGGSLLLALDACGLLVMGGAVWTLTPDRPRDALLLDLVVAWPLVPALVSWMIV